MIAGLETPTSGRITIGDTVVFDSELGINIPANKRKVGFLFQNYALWPNMTVYQNISFGLSNIKEEMPKIGFEAKNAARLAQIPTKPHVVKTLEECRDKNGKLDETKAIIKADRYLHHLRSTLPKSCSAIIWSKGRTCPAEVKALEKRWRAGLRLSPSTRTLSVSRDGEVETAVRKLTKEEIDLSVRRVSRIVKIGMFMDRYPGGTFRRPAAACCDCPNAGAGTQRFVHGRTAFKSRRQSCVWKCAMNCSGSMLKQVPPLFTSPMTRWRL